MIFLNFFLSSGETQNNEQDQRTVKANQQRRNWGRFVTRYKLRRLRFSRLDKRKQKHATPTQTANIATC